MLELWFPHPDVPSVWLSSLGRCRSMRTGRYIKAHDHDMNLKIYEIAKDAFFSGRLSIWWAHRTVNATS